MNESTAQPRKYRRKHFFINKGFQLRYMAVVSVPLLVICAVSFFSLYLGIWASILDSFTNEKIQEDLITAARMVQYEEVRHRTDVNDQLAVFKSAEKLTDRQREVFKEILDETNKDLAGKIFIILILIAAGTIFVSHKIAGPLYHISRIAKEVQGGNYGARIRLRKWDEAHPLADDINGAIEAVDETFSKVKASVENEDCNQAVSDIKSICSEIQTGNNA